MYKKIKRQNGETFARTLRDHHNGLLEIPDIDKIVRHAGRDAEPLLPFHNFFCPLNVIPVTLKKCCGLSK